MKQASDSVVNRCPELFNRKFRVKLFNLFVIHHNKRSNLALFCETAKLCHSSMSVFGYGWGGGLSGCRQWCYNTNTLVRILYTDVNKILLGYLNKSIHCSTARSTRYAETYNDAVNVTAKDLTELVKNFLFFSLNSSLSFSLVLTGTLFPVLVNKKLLLVWNVESVKIWAGCVDGNRLCITHIIECFSHTSATLTCANNSIS